jgi:hypothetical protein
MLSACAGADGAGGHQRHSHCTDNGVACPVALVPSQDHSRAADMLRVLGEGREHPILGIGSSLRVTRFVFVDDLDTHGFHRFKRPGRFSTPAMFSSVKDTVLSSMKARARPHAARHFPDARVGNCLLWPAGRRSGAFRTETRGFRMKSASKPGGKIRGYAPSPYCFILRQSVTVLIFRASAA